MTIDENRAREVLAATCPGLCLSESEKQGVALAISVLATEAAQPEGWVPSRVLQALAWYERHAKGCRKIGSAGDPFRNALDTDGGELARQAIAALATSPTPPAPLQADAGEVERAVMVCPQCEGEGGYPDGVDDAACHTDCTRCGGNGWIVDTAALTARQDAATDAGVERALSVIETYKRASSHPYAQKVAQAIHDAVSALITPKPGASQGEALATQENNHAG